MESPALLENDHHQADRLFQDPADQEKPDHPSWVIRFPRPESEDVARHQCKIYDPEGKLKKIIRGTTVGEVMGLPLPLEDHPWAAGRPRCRVGIHYRRKRPNSH